MTGTFVALENWAVNDARVRNDKFGFRVYSTSDRARSSYHRQLTDSGGYGNCALTFAVRLAPIANHEAADRVDSKANCDSSAATTGLTARLPAAVQRAICGFLPLEDLGAVLLTSKSARALATSFAAVASSVIINGREKLIAPLVQFGPALRAIATLARNVRQLHVTVVSELYPLLAALIRRNKNALESFRRLDFSFRWEDAGVCVLDALAECMNLRELRSETSIPLPQLRAIAANCRLLEVVSIEVPASVADAKQLALQIAPAIEGDDEALSSQDASTAALLKYYRAHRA